MKLQNLSVRAFLRKIVAGTLLTAALLLLIFFLLTKDVRVVICGIILTAAFYIWGMVFLHYFQKKLSLFTDGLCQTLDHMMDSTDRPQVDYEAETLLSRISHRLERLYNVMQKTRHTAEGEKEELQSLVSDISHQTKTPIANLKLINDTMLTRPLTEEKRKEFLQATGTQLDNGENFPSGNGGHYAGETRCCDRGYAGERHQWCSGSDGTKRDQPVGGLPI